MVVSVNANNVKIYRTSDPTGYQMEYNPLIDPYPEDLGIPHELDSGLSVTYEKNLKLHLTLTWKEPNFFRGDQWEELRQIFNSKEGLCVYPCPDTNPTAVYQMKWVNGWNIHLVRGKQPYGYEGTVDLEGTEILTEIPSTLKMATL